MGNKSSKSGQSKPSLDEVMDKKRPFNTCSGSSSSSQTPGPSKITSDLYFKIGTRVATITATYEPVQPKPVSSQSHLSLVSTTSKNSSNYDLVRLPAVPVYQNIQKSNENEYEELRTTKQK